MSDKRPHVPGRQHRFARLMAVQTAFTLVSGAVVVLDLWGVLDRPGTKVLAGLLVIVSLAWAVLWAARARDHQLQENANAANSTQLVEAVLATSREWLWALDDQGIFKYSSPASTDLFGYRPSELVGQHFGIVVVVEELPDAISLLVDVLPSRVTPKVWCAAGAGTEKPCGLIRPHGTDPSEADRCQGWREPAGGCPWKPQRRPPTP